MFLVATLVLQETSAKLERRVFGGSWLRARNIAIRALPTIPSTSKKSGGGAFTRDLPHIDDVHIPTYESIDAESRSPTASAPRGYEYPSLLARHRRRFADEHVYASTSQTYSLGSEDPYRRVFLFSLLFSFTNVLARLQAILSKVEQTLPPLVQAIRLQRPSPPHHRRRRLLLLERRPPMSTVLATRA